MSDKDLGNMFLYVWQSSSQFLDSLDSLASAMMISKFTTRSKYEHKYMDNCVLRYRKIFPWNLNSYAFPYVNKYVNMINA